MKDSMQLKSKKSDNRLVSWMNQTLNQNTFFSPMRIVSTRCISLLVAKSLDNLASSNECLASWWLNQPIWKICSSNWIISARFGVKTTNIWNHHLAWVLKLSCQGSSLPFSNDNSLPLTRILVPSEIREQGKAKCSKSMVVEEFKAHQYLPGFVMPLPKRNPTKITNPILVGGSTNRSEKK